MMGDMHTCCTFLPISSLAFSFPPLYSVPFPALEVGVLVLPREFISNSALLLVSFSTF